MNAPIPITVGQRALFIQHSGFSQAVSRIDILAEHLAEGATVPEAAKLMGIPSATANGLFQRMRKRLGPQAR